MMPSLKNFLLSGLSGESTLILAETAREAGEAVTDGAAQGDGHHCLKATIGVT